MDPKLVKAVLEAARMANYAGQSFEAIIKSAVAAALPLIRKATLEEEREAIAKEARRYASHYPLGSDGSNTFIMFAQWCEARSLIPAQEKQE